MGGQSSRNPPQEFERAFPHFKHFFEVGPGLWNCCTDFYVARVANIGTHCSVAAIGDNRFAVLDAAPLSAAAKRELDELTDNGTKIAACIFTHSYHTLSIPQFHADYPATADRKYYGCPRHLKVVTTDAGGAPIEWSGDLNDEATRRLFEPHLEMRIPAGSEFVDPQPPQSNHFSSVFVFHPQSRTVVQADTVVYYRSPGVILRIVGVTPFKMSFHPTLKSSGLYHTKEGPLDFMAWFQKMLDDWDFVHLLCAHNGGCYNEAKTVATELLKKVSPVLRELSERNAAEFAEGGAAAGAAPSEDDPGAKGWGNDPKSCDCG